MQDARLSIVERCKWESRRLSKWRQSAVEVLSKCCRSVVEVLSKCCRSVVKVLSKCCQSVVKVSSKCCQSVVKVSSKCRQSDIKVSLKVLSKCCRSVVKVSSEDWRERRQNIVVKVASGVEMCLEGAEGLGVAEGRSININKHTHIMGAATCHIMGAATCQRLRHPSRQNYRNIRSNFAATRVRATNGGQATGRKDG